MWRVQPTKREREREKGHLEVVSHALLIIPPPIQVFLVAAVGYGIWHDAKKREFIVELSDALGPRIVQLAGPIIAKDISERLGITVEEILQVK